MNDDMFTLQPPSIHTFSYAKKIFFCIFPNSSIFLQTRNKH